MNSAYGQHLGTFRNSHKLGIYLSVGFGFIAFMMFGVGGRALFAAWGAVILIAFLLAESFSYRVDLHDNALICKTLTGKVEIRLDSATKYIYREFDESLSFLLIQFVIKYWFIWLSNGQKKLKLSPRLKNLDTLRRHLIEAELRDVLPAARAAYASGQGQDFNLVRIEDRKLFVRKKAIDISDITRILLESGVLKIWVDQKVATAKQPSTRPAFQFNLYKVANAVTLLTLLEEVTEPNAG